MKSIEESILANWEVFLNNENLSGDFEACIVCEQNRGETKTDNLNGKTRSKLIELFLFGKRQQAIELRNEGNSEEGRKIIRTLARLNDYSAGDFAFRKFIQE